MLPICSVRPCTKEANDYAQIFEDQRDIYEFGQTWSLEVYEQKERNLKTYRTDMNQQRDWKQAGPHTQRCQTLHFIQHAPK